VKPSPVAILVQPGTAAELPNMVIMVSQNILRSLCFAPAEDVVIIVFPLIANDKTLYLSFFVGGPLDDRNEQLTTNK